MRMGPTPFILRVQKRFCQVRKVSPKNHAFVMSSRTISKKVPQLLFCKQVMIVSYIKLSLQEFLFGHVLVTIKISANVFLKMFRISAEIIHRLQLCQIFNI